MPRRQAAPSRPSGSRSASTHAPSQPTYQQAQHPPASAPTHSVGAPVAQPQQPGLFAQMASTAAGVAVGSTIGHTMGHAITGMFSGGSQQAAPAPVQEQPQQFAQPARANPCEADSKAFLACLEKSNNDIGSCQFYYDSLKACQAAARTYA